MKLTLRGAIALVSWGVTAVMMHPSTGALIVLLLNASLLCLLVFNPKKGP